MTTAMEVATASEARELTDRIKVAVEGSWQLIKQAYVSRAWDALGYASWDDYCTREFGTSRLRLPREERQEVVASLREIGMSTRAIAAGIGVQQKTIVSDLKQVKSITSPEPGAKPIRSIQGEALNGSTDPEPVESERVTGIDGKSYAAQPTRTPNRPQLPAQFLAVAGEMTRVLARIEKLSSDDRFRSNRGAIADQVMPQIRRAVEVLSNLMEELGDGA